MALKARWNVAIAVGAAAVAGAGFMAALYATGATSLATCSASNKALQAARIVGPTKQSYAKDNPNEYAVVRAYLEGDTRPDPTAMTHMGKHLVFTEDLCRREADSPTTTTTTTEPTTTTTTTEPPGVVYPASYYTGPLGNANPLPTKPGAFLIDFYGGIGTTTAQWKAATDEREASMGRKFDGLHMHYAGGGTYNGISTCVAPERISERLPQWVQDRGSLALVSWSPDRSLDDINAGLVDACFRAVADHFKTFGFTIMLRPFWEFNLSPFYAGTGQPHIDAWRRVVNIFKQQGATNVGFWWVPFEHADRDKIAASYPGDEYVDWVGSDAYNFCFVGEANCYSSPPPYGPGWAEFWHIADYGGSGNVTAHDRFGPRKPFVIGETSTVYDPNAPDRKGDWFRDIPRAAREMEYLRGISFYDADVSAVEGPRNNFRVDHPTSNSDVYQGFLEMARDPWFNTRG